MDLNTSHNWQKPKPNMRNHFPTLWTNSVLKSNSWVSAGVFALTLEANHPADQSPPEINLIQRDKQVE